MHRRRLASLRKRDKQRDFGTRFAFKCDPARFVYFPMDAVRSMSVGAASLLTVILRLCIPTTERNA
jgi:hypothetical protein